MDNPLLILARVASEWQHRELTSEVLHQARRTVLDWFAALIPGCTEGPALLLSAALATDRGTGQAISYTDGSHGAPRSAALLNGIASHTVEFDDIYRDGGYHPGSPTIAAALAIAQDMEAGEEQFLRAVIAGFEAGCRLAMALQPSHYRNWHITGTVGTIGAAVAVAFLKSGGSEEKIAHAIAIASSFAGGHQENLQGLGTTKPLHAGHAADAGLLAGLAAASGVTGSLNSLHAPHGFAAATSDGTGNWDAAFEGLGDWTPITRMTIKNHGCCGHIFASLDAMRLMQQQHSFRAPDIAAIEVQAYRHTKAICDRPLVESARDARFSVQYCVAAQLLTGGVRLAAFNENTLKDTALREIMAKVTVEEDPTLTALYPRKRQAKLKVTLRDGRIFSHHQLTRKGDPDDPLSDAELIEKFDELVGQVLPQSRAEALKAAILTPGVLPGMV